MRKQILVWSFVIFLIPSLACSLPGIGGQEPTPEPVATEVEAPAEEAVEPESATEAEPATATETETEDQSAVETESTTEEPSESEISAAPTEEASEAEATEETEIVESASTESKEISLADTSGLENLSSYSISFVMSFDGQSGGQPSKGTVNILLEATKEPEATHLTMNMEGTTVDDLGGMNNMEIYNMGDTVYMYSDAMGGQWISMPGGDSDAFSAGFFSPDQNLEVPKSADCSSSTETINGIEAKFCTFDAADLEGVDDATYDSAEGKVWLAEDGNYVVKYEVAMKGFKPGTNDMEGLFDFGDVNMTYELLAVDTDVTIELPAEAQSALSIDAAK
ncbi:MAG: hypothetical protein KDJ52_27190 [Anaerolineae bacterium]|nr:hypothetical protein [Anaerolineae bacterium]